MRGSPSRPNSRARLAAIALVLAGCLATAAAADGGVRVLRLSPAGDDLFATATEEPNLRAGPGEVVVVCRFDDSAFSVPSLDRLAVLLPSGRAAPLVVEAESVWEDLGAIVAVRFAFRATESDLAGPHPIRLRWGEGVVGERTEVPLLLPDPADRARFRVAAWAAEGAGEGDDTRIASIEVVADSRANYHSLLYLLPLAALVVLLAVGKVKRRDPAPPPPA